MPGYKKKDATSPTVHNKSTFIASVSDAYDTRDVMLLDIPGAFLRALTKEDIIVLLREPIVGSLVLIDPVMHHRHVIDTTRVQLLYKMNNALC